MGKLGEFVSTRNFKTHIKADRKSKRMNLNLFRYLKKEESSFYYQQKEKEKQERKTKRTDIYKQFEKVVSDGIANKEYFKGLEHIELNEKLNLPYEGRQLFTRWTHSYPNINKVNLKTFYIRYENELSVIDKIMLNNFQRKSLYDIIDDISYSLKSKPIQQYNLLSILYSPILYLHNSFSIDFFDIWIYDIYIHQESKVNKFLTKNNSNFEPFNYITIKLLYTTKPPVKKPEPLW